MPSGRERPRPPPRLPRGDPGLYTALDRGVKIVWKPVPAWRPGTARGRPAGGPSNVGVVALPKFFTPPQSTTTQPALAPPLRTPTRIAPEPVEDGLRSVQSGASTLFGLAAFGKCCGVNTMSPLSPPPTTM